jgi:peptidyl-prolyl cis-trans isomerase A (cyclophilin A)
MPAMKYPRWLPLLFAMACIATAAAPASAGTRVRVTTNVGAFVIELEDERAPFTVANFLRYVREGYYRQTVFHRVIAEFMIQGGGYGTDYSQRKAHDPIPNESGNGLVNIRGTVGLARTANPHSGDAQFYVNLVDNTDLNPLPSRWGYAVFGRIVEGMDVIDAIGVTPTGARGPFAANVPLKPVVIEDASVLGEPAAAPAAAPPAAGGAPPDARH